MPAHATINNSSEFLATPAELFCPRLAHLFPDMANAYREGSDTGFCSKKASFLSGKESRYFKLLFLYNFLKSYMSYTYIYVYIFMVTKIYSICYSGNYIHLYFLIECRILQCIILVEVMS